MTQRQFKYRRHELRERIKASKTAEEREALKEQLAKLRAEYSGKPLPKSTVLSATPKTFGTVPTNPENAESWKYDDPELNMLLAKMYAENPALKRGEPK
jgi:hypothetical protein